MSAMSHYLETKVVNWFRGVAFSAAPSVVYIALFTANPTDAGSFTNELSGGAYARQAVTLSATFGSELDGTVVSNVGAIVFAGLPAATITHVALVDAATGGNILMYAPLNVVEAVVSTGSVSFAPTILRFALTGLISRHLADIILNWARGIAAPSPPTTVYMALSKANPLRTGAGISEPPLGDNYTRRPITFGSPTSTLGIGTVIKNTNEIVFGPATNTSWGSITHLAMLDQAGSLLIYGAVTSPFVVPAGSGYGYALDAFALTAR